MKIGLISSTFPADLDKSVVGLYKRMGMFIQAFKELGDLDMLFYVPSDMTVNQQVVAEMEKRLEKHWDAKIRLNLCNFAPDKVVQGRWQAYISPALSIADYPPYMRTAQTEQISAVNRLLSRKPDILFVHRLSSMIPVLLSKCNHPRIYFDLDDVEHVAFARSIRQPPWWFGKWLYYLRLPILRRWERRAIELSRTTFICSEHDKHYLRRVFGCNNLEIVPNAINIPQLHDIPYKPTLLFLGLMSYAPNSVAADYLIKSIWPLIYSVMPDARLLIAGANPHCIESFSGDNPGVEFLGFVDDLEKLYKEVMVVCCPILSGGGTRIKILEAAAYGKPVVSTTIGAEGIALRDGKEILLRDEPRAFAEASIYLLKNRNISSQIGHAARTVAVLQYDRDNVVSKIKMHLGSYNQASHS